jgi:lipoprotein-anchoring transpeptidase ErfK/SrfK
MFGAVRLFLVATVVALIAIGGSGNARAAAVDVRATVAAVAGLTPARGEVVGIAQPVIINFMSPVEDRAAAEQDVDIATPVPISGRFTWLSDRVVQWAPETFWPAYTPVTVTVGDISTSFETGAAVMAVADISAHTFTVSIDEQVVREMPASLGKPGFDTPVGTFNVLEKQRQVKFDSRTIGIPLDSPEGYLIDGEYAVRVTWGGVYVHSAPWSVASQGNTNVSHGCINLSPDNAAWYFDTVRMGDPVIVQR